MRNSLLALALTLGALIALVGCGQPLPTPAPPTVTPTPRPPKPTAKIALTTNPGRPTLGEMELLITVTDKEQQPINDAVVFVVTNHIAMNHGMNGYATAQGNGQYAYKTIFAMSGDWKVTVQVTKPPLYSSKDFRLFFR